MPIFPEHPFRGRPPRIDQEDVPKGGSARVASGRGEAHRALPAKGGGERPPPNGCIPEKTTSDLEWPSLLGRLAQRCQIPGGKARALALGPLPRAEDCRHRLALVAQGRALRATGTPITLEGISDLRDLLVRVEERGVLDGPELLQIAATLKACGRLRKQGKSALGLAPDLGAILESLRPLADLRATIEESLDEHGAVVDTATPELLALRQRHRALREEAVRRIKVLLSDSAMQRVLQDDFYTDRDHRYVLPIKSELRHEVRGIVQGFSASGATVLMEPEPIIELNNRIKIAVVELEHEEQRILAELTDMVRQERVQIQANLDQLAFVDLLLAAARLADDLQCGPARISDRGQLVLLGLRHPLMVLGGTPVVDNSVELGPGATLIVTGPNTGGKTVLLKTVGLCCLMLRSGLFPSCTGESVIPFYDTLLSDMGDDQSIETSLSTFSAHMTNIGRILKAANASALVLLDEVAVGTDPIQGAALARAIVEALADREAQVLVTTHYAQLKELPARDARFTNVSLGFDLETVRPTYRLAHGSPGSSSALAVAKQLGLPAELLERAAGLLDPAAAKLDHLLRVLEAERTSLARHSEELQAEQAALHRAQEALGSERQAFNEERARLQQRNYDDAVNALRGVRDDLDRLRRRLKKTATQDEARELSRRVDRAAASLAAHAPRPPTPPSRPASAGDIAPGSRFWVDSLGSEAQVVEMGAGDQVTVQVGALKAKVHLSDLRVQTGKASATSTRPSYPGARTQRSPIQAPAAVQGDRPSNLALGESPVGSPLGPQGSESDVGEHFREPQTTCDLRGLRVDEAEEALARFLDRMTLAGARSVLVIHGHGTGALRQVVRRHLAQAPEVQKNRPGTPREGGDGVTVAFFR